MRTHVRSTSLIRLSTLTAAASLSLATFTNVALAGVPIPECEQLSLNHAVHSPQEAQNRARLQRICDEKRRAQPKTEPPARPAQRVPPQPAPQQRPATRSNPWFQSTSNASQQQAPQNGWHGNVNLAQLFGMSRPSAAPAPTPPPSPAYAGYQAAPASAPAPAAAPSPANAGLVGEQQAAPPSYAPSSDSNGATGLPMDNSSVQAPPVGVRDAALTRDQSAASHAHVDLGVFGLTIGEPLSLSPCPTGDVLGSIFGSGGVTDTCLGAGSWAAGMDALAGTMGHTRLAGAGYKDVPVTLANSKCPDWLQAGQSQCVLFASTKNGYVASLFFTAGGEDWQDPIEGMLSEKYHHAPAKDSVSQCKRRDLGVVTQQAHVRVWTLPGLRVSYDPLGALCASRSTGAGTGLITIEAASYHDSLERGIVDHEANQPKM